ncbi:beta-secretase 2-like [Scleropages formosus]|uniref:Beta-secretase 2 n=1 Tax=Scleropages formosus TaxID=113540 RepID=A0A0P7VCX0_SCLFO|nr:beta-secretase 2-like [Scleropages formosus]KPP80319.1 beta-secretase 2-like [Scleropages formosus]
MAMGGCRIALLFCCVSLAARVGTLAAFYAIPLKMFSGHFNSSAALDLSSLSKVEPTADGLSLASDSAGKVNFLDMVDNLEGDSGKGYYIEMFIGTPAQTLNILVDTGSSNFAVAAAPHPYVTHYFDRVLSSTYRSTDTRVAVKYIQGYWEGELGIDRVSIPKGPNGTVSVNIAAILSSDTFFFPGTNWQGILGLAYPVLAQPDSSVEPFFDSLVRQTGIPDVFSLQMCGAGISASESSDPAAGSLIIGGIEPTLYKGSVWYTPIKEEWYYQVEILKLEVGDQNLILDCKEYNRDKAIVDSGTTFLRLPENVFNAVVDGIIQTSLIQFSADFWTGTKLACWLKGQNPLRLFPKLSIYLRALNASQSFRITIFPQLYIQLISEIDDDFECFRFGISSSANGLVIGATVMEGFYVVFDRVRKRVGFAVSTCAESSGVALSEIAGPFAAADVSSNCLGDSVLYEPILWAVSYALMGVCALALLILLLLMAFPCHCRRGDRTGEITDESSLVRNRIK